LPSDTRDRKCREALRGREHPEIAQGFAGTAAGLDDLLIAFDRCGVLIQPLGQEPELEMGGPVDRIDLRETRYREGGQRSSINSACDIFSRNVWRLSGSVSDLPQSAKIDDDHPFRTGAV